MLIGSQEADQSVLALMTVSDPCPGFQGHTIFEVQYLRDKVTIAH